MKQSDDPSQQDSHSKSSGTDADTAFAQATVRFTAFCELTDVDRASLQAVAGPPRQYERGAFLTHEHDEDHGCFVLLKGWTASTMVFTDGSRAIIKVHMPGDMLGSPSMALTRSADSVMALTPCVVTSLSLNRIGRLFETNPRLAALLLLIAQEERVMLMDRLAVTSHGSALERVALLLLQLHSRALRSDASNTHEFDLPLAQRTLADLAGLTAVHVNRSLQRLKREDIAHWSRNHVTIVDQDRLRQIAGVPHRELARNLRWLPAPSK